MNAKIVMTGLLLSGQLSSFAQDEAGKIVQEAEVISEDVEWGSPGRISLTGRVLEENEEYAAGIMLPLFKSGPGMAFVDLRGAFIEDLEQELNSGLVARYGLANSGIILGLNVYYDGRWTDEDNRYDQVAGGIEIMSRWLDLRANYYYPITDATVLDESSEFSEERVGSRRIRTSVSSRSYEEALDGFDVEAGVWLPWVSKFMPVAIYAGYYQFNSDYIDDDSYGGTKARLEVRAHPNVTLSGEWFEESELNNSEYIASVRVQVPLDFWRKTTLPASGGPYEPIINRMSDEVYRDLRVRVVKTGPVEINRERVETSYTSSAPTATRDCYRVFKTDPVTGTITVTTVCP